MGCHFNFELCFSHNFIMTLLAFKYYYESLVWEYRKRVILEYYKNIIGKIGFEKKLPSDLDEIDCIWF